MTNETNSALRLSYNMEADNLRAPDTDARLVELSRQGDLDAFEQLVAKHQKRMLNIAFRLIGDYDDACEAVQDAFVSAFKNIRSFRAEAKFSTWLTTITLNHSRNKLKQVRSRSARISYSLNEPGKADDGEIAQDCPAKEPSALDRMEAEDMRNKVRGCVDALEPEYREVIILRDLQDFSYEEIGAALKTRAGTVKSRLFRAREAVKECLEKALEIV
jgi:RNA polymerase sigma-70 factor (ECF subfamily)